jgi:tRNA pseudouridine38-40 synthase
MVPHRFHARHHAISRRYVYQISRRRTAFAKAYVWWVKEPLDIGRMQSAAHAFVGMRDFRAFTPTRAMEDDDDEMGATRSTLVLLERLDIAEDGDLILVGIDGSHFLWRMVRRIVGVLAEIGRGGLDPAAAAAFMTAGSTTPARLTAPPSGLFLERVLYQGDDLQPRPLRAITKVG